jgi:alpha-1,2-mannosyltransferase
LDGSLVVRKDGLFRVRDAALLVAAFGVLVVALVINVRYGAGTLERISSGSMDVHMDFDIFWRSAEALREGRDIYDTETWESSNPPLWTVLISPLALLEPLTAYRSFVLITLAMSVGSMVWMADELRLRAGWTAIGVVMLVLSSPLLGTLALGQIYPVLALGLVAAWVADRHRRTRISGVALGLVVALKPSLAPVMLWPVVRRRWGTLGAALISGAVATIVGGLVAGAGALFDYVRLLADPARTRYWISYWDNASLPSAAARLFTENNFVEPISTLPWLVPVAYVLALGAIGLTVAKARTNPEMGLWALVAASLLASPLAWHNYLVLLGPGILLLLSQGQKAAALFLLALQSIPPQWPDLWKDEGTALAALALTLYLYILIAHWLAFLAHNEKTAKEAAAPVPDQSALAGVREAPAGQEPTGL